MPKKGRSNGRFDSVITLPFRFYATHSRGTAGTTITRIDLKATNLGTRVADVAVTFEYFRMKRLRMYVYLNAVSTEVGASAGLAHAVAYVNTPSTESTAPASFTTMAQSEYFVAGNSVEKLKLTLPARALIPETPEKWFATYSTGSPTEAQSAGCILIAIRLDQAVTNSVVQDIVIEGDIEFAVPNEPTLTRQRLLALLQDTPDPDKPKNDIRVYSP